MRQILKSLLILCTIALAPHSHAAVKTTIHETSQISNLPNHLADWIDEYQELDDEGKAAKLGALLAEVILQVTGPKVKVSVNNAIKNKLGKAAQKVVEKVGHIRFHDASELAKRLGVDKETFHKKTKKVIIKEAKKSFDLKPLGENPDIGTNGSGNIVFRSKNNPSKSVQTDIPLDNFKN